LKVVDPNLVDAGLLCWDPATRVATAMPLRLARHAVLLGWLDADTALLQEQATIQRLSVSTGARTQLFPGR
jgi:hypothetical protein